LFDFNFVSQDVWKRKKKEGEKEKEKEKEKLLRGM
jgi:hypothetical protein